MSVIDWTALKENCGGDDSLVTEVLDLFKKEAPTLLADVKAAVEKGDAEQVKRTAHRLKGALVSLAAPGAVALAKDLEAMGNAKQLAGAAAAYGTLEAEMQRLTVAIGNPAQAA